MLAQETQEKRPVEEAFVNHYTLSLILDEIRRLEAELLRQENLYDTLFEEKRAAMSELDSLRRLSSQQKESSNQQVDKIKKLERELNSKEEIVSYMYQYLLSCHHTHTQLCTV